MDYQGFVISDWQGIDRITNPPHSNYTYSVLESVQAGIDMVLYLSFCREKFSHFNSINFNFISYVPFFLYVTGYATVQLHRVH